jgi:hypothetical protein
MFISALYLIISDICILFFLLMCPNLLALGLICGLRNYESRASKPSKSPRDHTWHEPHQPLTWLDFFVPTGFEPVTFQHGVA